MARLYIRNSTDTAWIEFLSSDELSLAALNNVDAGAPEDGQVLAFDAQEEKWKPQTVLQFSGLAKISVGAAAPTSPSVNDVWIDTSV